MGGTARTTEDNALDFLLKIVPDLSGVDSTGATVEDSMNMIQRASEMLA